MKNTLKFFMIAISLPAFSADMHLECNPADAVSAQASALLKVAERIDDDKCSPPTELAIKDLCKSISKKVPAPAPFNTMFEHDYEKRIWDMACAKTGPGKIRESDEAAKIKINKMWKTYGKDIKCDYDGFEIRNGNVLKFALNRGFPKFIDTLVSNYQIDINFVDPVDNKNVMDFLIESILAEQNNPDKRRLELLLEYKSLMEELGATASK